MPPVPILNLSTGGYQLSYTKFPMLAHDAVQSGELSGVGLRVYLCLCKHSRWKTGELEVPARVIAGEVGIHRASVYRYVRHIRKLGLLVDGQGTTGTLVGFTKRPYRSKHAAKAAVGPVQQERIAAEAKLRRDKEHTDRYVQEMMSPAPEPSDNGGGYVHRPGETIEEKRIRLSGGTEV